MSDEISEPVPKLPRGRGMKFSGPELFRIALTLGLLVAVVLMTKPCSTAVSTFVMGFQGSGSAVVAKPGTIDVAPPQLGSATLIPLKGMTDEQVKATVEHARGSAGSANDPAIGRPVEMRRGSAAP